MSSYSSMNQQIRESSNANDSGESMQNKVSSGNDDKVSSGSDEKEVSGSDDFGKDVPSKKH